MTKNDEKRFIFTGHAIGVGAHVHRIHEHTGLNHLIPTLGTSVLPVTGGLSESKASNYCYAVHEPVKKRLLSVRHVETRAHGYFKNGSYQTDIDNTVEHSTWAERVHFERLSLKMRTTHTGEDVTPNIVIKDVKIEGVRLGSVTAHVEVDDEPFCSCGTQKSLADFWASQTDKYRQENAARFHTEPGDSKTLKMHNGYYVCSVVRKITLTGPPNEIAEMKVEGNMITWDDPDDHKVGFGKIILGEVLVREHDRRITLARLQMGCPVGGSGTGGEGQSNGGPHH